MHDDSLDRRQFLRAGGALALWFVATPSILRAENGEESPAHAAPPRYKVLTATQAATFIAFASQVIPSEPGSPGAREANVVRFADEGLASHVAAQRPAFLQALTALDAEAARLVPGAVFARLPSAQQVASMHAFDSGHHELFETLRTPVLAGMFSNPAYGGNANKVGWTLIGFEDRFYWSAPFGHYDTAEALRRHD